MRIKSFVVGALLVVGVAVFAGGAAAKNPNGDQPSPIARGPHISGVARYQPKPSPAPSAGAQVSCSEPGNGNYRTDCNSSGRPVNETWVARAPDGTYYAGANDYNSYNGQGQDGFYWSSDGVNWNDAGPIDVFPHNNNNGAGDPGLAVDSNGVLYYSSLFFNFYRCNVGGVELLRRDSSGNWSYTQIAANSSNQFQDKPAMTLSGGNVYVSWTQFNSCTGSSTSPIEVAVMSQGPTAPTAATTILSLPTGSSKYSQGSSIASDGSVGFWIAWEEWPSPTATNGEIRLAHYDGSGWATLPNGSKWETISPSGFRDLPSSLPGFKFRDNSFPALTVTSSGSPEVAWTSYDSGVGRAYLWNGANVTPVSNTGGDQFFPSIAPDGSGGVYVAYSQVTGSGVYDQFLAHNGTVTKVSTASSKPSNDAFFSGQFIGDYNGMAFDGTTAHPIWTDIRGPDSNYSGWEMDSMIAGSASAPTPTPGFTLSASPASVTAGQNTTSTVTVTPQNGYTGTVSLSLSGTLPAGVSSGGASASVTSSSSVQVPLPIDTTSNTPAGTYTLTITGTSSNPSASSSTTVSLTVNPASGSAKTMTVSVVADKSTLKGPNYRVPLTVTALDSSGPIGGATVSLDVYSGTCSGTPSGTPVASGTGTTGSDGTAGFSFRTKATGSWCALATASAAGYSDGSDSTTFYTPNP